MTVAVTMTTSTNAPLGDASTDATPSQRCYGALLASAGAVVAVDQLSKWWVVNNVSAPRTVVGPFRLTAMLNHGVAFSAGSGAWLGPLVAGYALVAVAVMLRSPSSTRTAGRAVAVGLMIGGAAGNLVDRLLRDGPGRGPLGGGVVDFISVGGGWPVFNLADAFLCAGVAGVAATALLASKQ